MSKLTAAVTRGDVIEAGEVAHKLGGSSGTLGAARVSHLASQLEVMAATGHLSTGGGLLEALRRDLAGSRTAFAERARRFGRRTRQVQV